MLNLANLYNQLSQEEKSKVDTLLTIHNGELSDEFLENVCAGLGKSRPVSMTNNIGNGGRSTRSSSTKRNYGSPAQAPRMRSGGSCANGQCG